MREIYIVNATQVVTSESHPEGAFSVVSGYPKTFDSRNYNATEENPDGDATRAYEIAEAEYHDQFAELLRSTTRAMWAVTFERADGRQIAQASKGAIPSMNPPVPVPEQEAAPALEE